MNDITPKIILMGPVGSGKSTQADLLAKHLGVPHVVMGDILREIGQENEEVRGIVETGKLVPDELTLNLLTSELSKEKYKNGFIMDGVPRTIFQAQNLPFIPDAVIYLRVRDIENVKRLLLRGRTDDTESVIRERLAIYHKDTEPILDFYRKQGKLLEVDGEPKVEVISKDILQKLKETKVL